MRYTVLRAYANKTKIPLHINNLRVVLPISGYFLSPIEEVGMFTPLNAFAYSTGEVAVIFH